MSEAEARPAVSFSTMDTFDPQDFVTKPALGTPAKAPRAGKPSSLKKTLHASNAGTTSVKAEEKPVALELIETFKRVVSDSEAERPIVHQDSGVAVAVTSTGDAKVDQLVTGAASRYRLDPNLIFAVMRQESSFNPRAVSYKGARGLMQLMPATAARLGVRDIFDPAQNIDGGARYLRFLLDTFDGDVQLALAGYNAGEGAVARYGNRIPPYRETINYVQRISAHYDRLKSGNHYRSIALRKTTSGESLQTVELVRGVRTLSQF